jgi:ribonucleoside-diphosphate reductase alpha chain
MQVRKRDSSIQNFDERKVRKALYAAFSTIDTRVPDLVPITRNVLNLLFKEREAIVSIDTIQEAVETVLMDGGFHEVAKAYILYREQRNQVRAQRLSPDPRAIQDYIATAKYSRYLEDEKCRESYVESVSRVHKMQLRRYQNLSPERISKIAWAYDMMQEKRVLGSMRALQFGGRAMEVNNARGYNCCGTHLNRVRVFQEIMWLLLSGCGDGFSVQLHHIAQLPRLPIVTSKVRHFIIEDTIEGWSDAVGALWQAALAGEHIEYAYHQIRDRGERLITSGGRAPGHLGLREALEACRRILLNAQGRRLRSIEAYDFVCYLAQAVLSGGIRRSALLCIFSKEDSEMMYAKAHGNFDPRAGINPQRALSNNSVALLRETTTRADFDRIMDINREWGEPGVYFTHSLEYIGNPCVEIGMFPYIDGRAGISFCNLTERNIASCQTGKDVLDTAEAAAIIGTLQAGYQDFHYLTGTTHKIVARDALLGVSMCGMSNNPDLAYSPELQQQAVEIIRCVNADWAQAIGINSAARATCIKPGGTGPLVLGSESGITDAHARRYFRRVMANPTEPPAQQFKKYNPLMVEERADGLWSIVFPMEASAKTRTVKETSALEFLQGVYSTYKNYILPGTFKPDLAPGLTHNISCTVSIRDAERDDVIESVWKNRDRLAAISFAPMDLDKKFPHAPREEVTTAQDEARWNEIIRNYVPVDWKAPYEEEDNTHHVLEPACAGGVCEI